MSDPDPWSLPSARAALRGATDLALRGGALLRGLERIGPDAPARLRDELTGLGLGLRVEVGAEDMRPAEALRILFGDGGVEAIAGDHGLGGRVAIVPAGEAWDAWANVARRFHAARAAADDGPALLVLVPAAAPAPMAPSLDWAAGGFGRVDRTIWALDHLSESDPPLAELAEALAVELGGQDLRLVARIAGAPRERLIRPELLFEGVAAAPTGRAWREALWRAQTRALFPWLEEQRQRVVADCADMLRLDDRARALGVRDVRGLELGALLHQLGRDLSRTQRDRLEAMRDLRNAIAHGAPCPFAALDVALPRG